MDAPVISDSAEKKNAQEQYVQELINRRAPVIDAIQDLPGPEQRKMFQQYGVDPNDVIKKYDHLEARSNDLEQRNLKASKAIKAVTLGAMASTFAGMMLADKKHYSNNRGIQAIISGMFTLFAGVAANFFATKIFTSKIREESAQLARESRDAERRELALGIERNELIHAADLFAGEAAQETQGKFSASTSRAAPPVSRGDSYVQAAERSKEAPPIQLG